MFLSRPVSKTEPAAPLSRPAQGPRGRAGIRAHDALMLNSMDVSVAVFGLASCSNLPAKLETKAASGLSIDQLRRSAFLANRRRFDRVGRDSGCSTA